MKFPPDDLLAAQSQSTQTILKFASLFRRWCDARRRIITCALDEFPTREAAQGEKDDAKKARAEIDWFRNESLGNGQSLDDVFLAWMAKHARIRTIALTIGSVHENTVSVEIPPRAQILAPLPPGPSLATEEAWNPVYEVASVHKYKLLTMSTGKQYLVALDETSSAISAGSQIIHSGNARRVAGGWFLLP